MAKTSGPPYKRAQCRGRVEDETNGRVDCAGGASHGCGFFSAGGSPVLEIRRRSRRGQRAAAPGKIKTRNPAPLPIACESIRFTPVMTKAIAKTNPARP